MPDTSGQSSQTSVNPNGHSQTASPAGQGQSETPSKFAIGAFNTLGVDPTKAVEMQSKVDTSGTVATDKTQTTQVNPGQNETNETKSVATRQLTEKDERHFSQYVTKASQEKYDIAKLAVEANEEAIFDIAKTDKDLAQRLLKEYDYGTDSIDELLEQKVISKSKNPVEVQKEIEDTKWKQQMEKDLMEEKILRLKGEDAELNGAVEEKLRELWSDKAFSKYDEKTKVAMAKTLTGNNPTQSNANDVALAVLQREEGVVTSPRGTTATDKQKNISPEMRKMMQSGNITEKDLSLLPPNMDELISQMYGPLVGN